MSNPLVSVIVPSFNHENYIESALNSVLSQTYRPLEIIVIDDGSTDRTAQVAKAYLSANSKSAVFISQNNKGAAETINLGMKISSGKYLNILNSDDAFDVTRVEKCVSAAERHDLEFIYTGVDYINAKDDLLHCGEYVQSLRRAEAAARDFPTLGFAFLKNQLAISTGNMFMARTLVDRVGRFRSYSYVHDWDYVLRCIFYTEPFALHERLYKYRLHDSNSFRSLRDIEGYETYEVMANALHRFISAYPQNRRAPSPHFWPGTFEKFIADWDYHIYLPPKFRQPLRPGDRIK
ncbi:glycosyltransferase family 2 protein [Methylobacterium sp. P31]